MNWSSVRRWPMAALLFAVSLTSAAQQPAPQPSPAVQPPVAQPSPQPSSVDISGRERVTVTGMVPIPDVGPGAPRYTSTDIKKIEQQALDVEWRSKSDYRRCGGRLMAVCNQDSLRGLLACEQEYALKAANLAGKAETATKAAEAVRRNAAAARASAADVEAAELKRQDAVNKMQAMREKLADARADIGVWQDRAYSGGDYFGLGAYAPMQHGSEDDAVMDARVFDLALTVWTEGVRRKQVRDQAGGFSSLRIEGVRASFQNDKKGSLLVQGNVVNASDKTVEVPGLVAMLIDERNWVVARKSVTPDKSFRVAGNSSQPFGFLVEAAPQAMRRAVVAFAHETEAPSRIGVGALCPAIPGR